MSATARENLVVGGAVLALLAACALLGGLFGLLAYALYEALTLDPGLPDLVGLLLDFVTRAPVTAAYVGAATYVVGALVLLWRREVLLTGGNSALRFALDVLGAGTFVGLLGVPTSMVVHAWRSVEPAPEGVVDLLVLVVAGLPTVAFDMLVVGFLSPVLLSLALLSLFVAVLAALWLAERRDSVPW